MPDELYAELQIELIRRPTIGDLIPGSGGLRKVRWKTPDKGKRGGIRVIYYWLTQDEQILLLTAYTKAKQENLSKDQIKLLKQLVNEELNDG